MSNDSEPYWESRGDLPPVELDPAPLVLTNPYEDADIRFYAEADEPVFTISSDGVISFGKGISPTEAAEAFIAAVRTMLPEATELRVAP